jgi:hypothetical protein
VFAVVGDVFDVGEELGDEGNPERVSGQQRDRADRAGCDADVVLLRVAADGVLVDDVGGDGVLLDPGADE